MTIKRGTFMLYMNSDILRRLQKLNQLKLTDTEEAEILAFFEKQKAEMDVLNAIDTENVERMVQVMPIYTVVREDDLKVLNSVFRRFNIS